MDREVEDIMEDNDTDGGASDDDEEIVCPVDSNEPEGTNIFVLDFHSLNLFCAIHNRTICR